ncbi:hypothetical protein ACFX1W_039468 [Malus domestica]
MPLLQVFYIERCQQLKEVPSGIHHLQNLISLGFGDMPKEFARQMDPNNGPHYWIVKHIPHVSFGYKSGPRFDEYEVHYLYDSDFSFWLNA